MDIYITLFIIFAILCAVCGAGWVATAAILGGALKRKTAEAAAELDSCRTRLDELSRQAAALGAENRALVSSLEISRGEAKKYLEEKISAEKMSASYAQKISSLSESVEQREKRENELRAKMEADFEVLSNRLLEASRQKLSSSNMEQLSLVLTPLKTNIADFKSRIDAINLESAKSRAGMEAQIQGLVKMNSQLSDDAKNLASALRGNNKIAGNWGETILQKILESCGFKEGVHFRTQASYRDSSGAQQRLMPDFIIDLPDSRSIVIDSKMSLVDYADYSAAQEQSAKRAAIEKFKKSVRTHLAELAGKYDALPDVNCGFTMMFMPIEPAYELALESDEKLASDAYAQNILIVGPSSVMAVLKFAEILTRNAAVEKNTREIAALGELLYKRVNLFCERFAKVGERISTLSKEYDNASISLSQGGKSVVSTSRRLGAKSSGEILESIESQENE